MNNDFNLCLNYHDFSGTNANTHKDSKYTLNFGSFKDQLNLLMHLQNLPVSVLTREFKASFSLTFDDGLKSNLYIAQELAKRNLIGTFYIIKNKSELNSDYLNINDIKAMNNMGMEFGSHSCSHRHLNRLSTQELIKELRDSKSFIEDIISKPIHSIAYPGGHFGRREIKISKQEGYFLNRTCISGLNYHPIKNGIIKCISITNDFGLNDFSQIVNLSPYFFARNKLRQLILTFPKYLESIISASKEIKS